MSIVRFAVICDHPGCGRRSEEYGYWWTCRECLLDTCDRCLAPGTETEGETMKCLCKDCAAWLKGFEAPTDPTKGHPRIAFPTSEETNPSAILDP